MGTTTAAMSLQEFEQLDFEADQIELLEGELIRLPPAFASHMDIVQRLFKVLDRWRDGVTDSRLGAVHIEMGYLLTEDRASWLQPDVSLTHPNQRKRRYYEGAPLMVFEVISEYDRARHVVAKAKKYLAHGAQEIWVIYPEDGYAQVYRGPGEAVLEEQAIHSPLLPGLEIPLKQLLSV